MFTVWCLLCLTTAKDKRHILPSSDLELISGTQEDVHRSYTNNVILHMVWTSVGFAVFLRPWNQFLTDIMMTSLHRQLA